MATLKYIIRKNQKSLNKDGTTLLFLRYTHRGSTAYFSTSKSIPVHIWNHDGQRIKSSFRGHSTLNIYLSKFRQRLEDIINRALFEGIEPTPNYVRRHYDDENNTGKGKQKKQRKVLTFDQFVQEFIYESKQIKAKSTIRTYTDVLNILSLYCKRRRLRKLDWFDFTVDWYYDFMSFYIEERGASNNSFGKMIKTLKTFLNAATEQGYNQNLQYKDKRFKVLVEEVSNIYLNEDEIKLLLDLNLDSDINLKTIRDLFVIGCYTGLRFSDYKQLNEQNISSSSIKIKTQKTGQYVVIPLHPIVRQILNSYENRLPSPYCNQMMNRGLKEIGKLAEINETIIQVRTHGVNRIEKTYHKYELISTHCARRSFATNLFKQGFPAINIMKITGHRTEKAFMRYIKITEEEVADMLSKHWKDNYAA